MKYLIPSLISFFVLSSFIPNFKSDWAKTGHRATGEIAQKYLTKKAERKINELLDGHSLAFVSNYGDEIKSDKAYWKYSAWHYVNFPFDGRYETSPKSERGDIIMAIDSCVRVLKNPKSLKKDKVFFLKMLVHFMGDLHQPLHIGLAEDKGGNTFQVQWFKKGTNLHHVWDEDMIEFYNMSYTELAKNTDKLTKEQIKQIQKGTVLDWMYDSRALCKDIYANTKIGEKLGYRYMYDYMDALRFQLQKGGIRLAVLLNQIYK